MNQEFTRNLDESELDELKYLLSCLSIRELENEFEVSKNPARRESFFAPLRHLAKIHSFSDSVQPFGILYRGRPKFMTSVLLEELRSEADSFREAARTNYNHYLYQLALNQTGTAVERLYESTELQELIEAVGGPCLKSHLASYAYYDQPGRASEPHVDNAFSSLTVMLNLKHDCLNGQKNSKSVFYWPDHERLEFELKPGEIVIFHGVSAVHGRTPVIQGEVVHSLLMSFRPKT